MRRATFASCGAANRATAIRCRRPKSQTHVTAAWAAVMISPMKRSLCRGLLLQEFLLARGELLAKTLEIILREDLARPFEQFVLFFFRVMVDQIPEHLGATAELFGCDVRLLQVGQHQFPGGAVFFE